MFRVETEYVNPSQPKSTPEVPYVKPGQTFTIPASDKPIEIPDWVTKLPAYEQAVEAGVLTPYHAAGGQGPGKTPGTGAAPAPAPAKSKEPEKEMKTTEELQSMTKAELVEYGETLGLKLGTHQSKDDLVTEIEEAQLK
jgi:hypothetical protein